MPAHRLYVATRRLLDCAEWYERGRVSWWRLAWAAVRAVGAVWREGVGR